MTSGPPENDTESSAHPKPAAPPHGARDRGEPSQEKGVAGDVAPLTTLGHPPPDALKHRAIHEYFVLIRENHLDTFGHVNNATYLQLFEEARWDLITERGYGKDVIFERRLGPVILDVSVKFRREVRNREQTVIRTELMEHAAKIGKLRQRLYKCADRQLACEALFSIALWDLDARKLVEPTPEWAHAIQLDVRPL